MGQRAGRLPAKGGRRIVTYGCHNSERKESYWVHVRDYRMGGTYTFKSEKITDLSSKECRYDFRHQDKLCEGCSK